MDKIQFSNKLLWEKCFKLWENGQSFKELIETNKNYWEGKISKPIQMTENFFKNTKETSHNICKRIVETKVSHLLDAKFSIAVLPKENPYANLDILQAQQDYADILTEIIQNVLKDNNFDELKEQIIRWGYIGGFGASQVVWQDYDDPKGNIKITNIDPRCMKWQRNSKSIDDTSFFAYEIEINATNAKERFAKNIDGTYNKELCDKIDLIAKNISNNANDDNKKDSSNYIAYKNEQNSGLAYVRPNDGEYITANKTVKLIVMFLLDDTLFLEQTNNEDPQTTIENANFYRKMYPNGRMIIFSPEKKSHIILEDKVSPESFKNLGNIDIFNPISFGGLEGVSQIKDLIPIQNRINGLLAKSIWLTQNHVSGLWIDNTGQDLEDSSFVWQSIQFSNGEKNPPVAYGNDCLSYNQQLIDYIKQLEEEAMETAGLNQTMISGARQIGTTSAEQVEALQESPMANIRLNQRNFKQYIIHLGEKIIAMVKEYYNTERLIKLSTGITDYEFARFTTNQDQQMIELLDKSLNTIKQIKIDSDWKFFVDIISGTEIPRNRKENAMIIEKLYLNGILGDINDIRVKELYLKALDVPNYRAYIKLQEQIAKEMSEIPQQPTIEDIIKNPDMAKAFNDILKALEYNSRAKAQVLKLFRLEGSTDTLEDAPIQSVTSKAEVTDIVAISPEKISRDPNKDFQGRAIAGAIIDNKQGV